MTNKTSGIFIAILLMLYGLIEILSFTRRDIFTGIAFVFYGVGTMMIATQKTSLTRIGIGINFITLVLVLAALLYEKFS